MKKRVYLHSDLDCPEYASKSFDLVDVLCKIIIFGLVIIIFIGSFLGLKTSMANRDDYKSYYNNYTITSDSSIESIEHDFASYGSAYKVVASEDDNNFYITLEDNTRNSTILDSRALPKEKLVDKSED